MKIANDSYEQFSKLFMNKSAATSPPPPAVNDARNQNKQFLADAIAKIYNSSRRRSPAAPASQKSRWF